MGLSNEQHEQNARMTLERYSVEDGFGTAIGEGMTEEQAIRRARELAQAKEETMYVMRRGTEGAVHIVDSTGEVDPD